MIIMNEKTYMPEQINIIEKVTGFLPNTLYMFKGYANSGKLIAYDRMIKLQPYIIKKNK